MVSPVREAETVLADPLGVVEADASHSTQEDRFKLVGTAFDRTTPRRHRRDRRQTVPSVLYPHGARQGVNDMNTRTDDRRHWTVEEVEEMT